MARPPNLERRNELLDAAVEYVEVNGLADLSWRTVASKLDVSPTTLVHYFGTKDELLQAILGRVRERIRQSAAVGPRTNLAEAMQSQWAWSSSPERGPFVRMFFAIYGTALQHPDQFSSFLRNTVPDLIAALDTQGTADPVQTTLAVATIRGLLLDLLTTGDTQRVNDALAAHIASIPT